MHADSHARNCCRETSMLTASLSNVSASCDECQTERGEIVSSNALMGSDGTVSTRVPGPRYR